MERKRHALFSLVDCSVGACGSGYTNERYVFIGRKRTEHVKIQTALISVVLCGELRRKYSLPQTVCQQHWLEALNNAIKHI